MLLLISKDIDTFIEQTNPTPQETLEFKSNKQIETFSFIPPINVSEEGEWLLAATFFETTNSVSKITHGNISFSTIIPGHWSSNLLEKTIDELNKLLKLKSQTDIELHVEKVRKNGIVLKYYYSLSSIRPWNFWKWNTWRIKKCKIQWSWRYGI